MKFVTLRLFLFVLAVAAFLSVPAMAQYTPGSVTGTVVDPMGAVVPGATVELIDPATGFVRTQETTDSGQFSFERVASRVYTLRVTKQGFRTTELTAVEVSTGKVTVLGDVRLEVGGAGELVTVEAAAVPVLQAETAQITGNYSTRQVSEAIFGIMGADATAFLTPGVQPGVGTGFSNSNTGAGSTGVGGLTGLNSDISVNGMRGRSNNFTYDGQSINDVTVAGPGLFVANLDAVQEYQITTNQFNADQGRNMGATINVVSKGGGNDVHGTAFWFHENNSALGARSSGESQGDAEKPAFFLDNFGGFTLGGPVVKNKLFAFGSFYVERNPGSALSRSGTLALTDAGVATVRAAFPASTTMMIYEAGGPLQRANGDPSCQAGTTTLTTFAGVAGVEACLTQRSIPQSFDNEEFTSRLDWNGKKNSFWGRYYFSDNAFCCLNGGGASAYTVAIPARSQALGLTHSIQLSPRMLNEFRFNFTRLFVTFEGGSTFPASAIGDNLTNIVMPTGFLGFGLATNLPQGRGVTDFQFQDNWSVTRGRHTIKAGMDVRRDRQVNFFLPTVNGSFSFNNTTRFVNNQPSAFAFASGEFTLHTFATDWYYYVQDDIRLNNFLGGDVTLNLGLRYENNGQPLNNLFDETLARESDPARAFWLQTVPVEQRIYPKVDRDDNNWAPRLGFAYSPKWGKALFGENKTVIRGGYGIAYEVAFTNMLLNSATASPVVFNTSNTCAVANPALCPPIPGTGTGAEVAGAATPAFNTINPRVGAFANWTLSGGFVNPNLLQFYNPYSQNWSLGFQREIGRSSVFEMRYVGTKGTGLFQTQLWNPNVLAATGGFLAGNALLPPGATPVTIPPETVVCDAVGTPGFGSTDCAFQNGRPLARINTAKSIYHSLQTRLETRNWKNQLTGGIAWTWSHNIDTVSEVFADATGSISNPQNPFDLNAGERGTSNIDARHTVAINAVWDLPWRRDQKGAVGKVLGGWELTGYALIYSPRPWTAFQNFFGGRTDAFRNPFCSSSVRINNSCRPILANPNAPITSAAFFDGGALFDLNTGDPTTFDAVRWIVLDSEAVAAGFPFGSGRNSPGVVGDNTRAINLGIFKNTYVGSENQVNIQFRMIMVNAFNHRNFGPPFDARIDVGGFADPTFNDVIGRKIRFGLRVVF